MLAADYHTTGQKAAIVRGVLARTDQAQLAAAVFDPWARWLLHSRIPTMYWQGGRVSGADGQPQWSALSKWTIASKGVMSYVTPGARGGQSTKPMITAEIRMAQSYHLDQQRLTPTSWLFRLTNTAKARSKYSPLFPYPSILHTGCGPWVVRPRPDNKRGVLAWPMMKGTVITAAMGRARSGAALSGFGYESYVGRIRRGKKGPSFVQVKATSGRKALTPQQYQTRTVRRKKETVGSNWAFALETHPQGIPPRPHIKFFRADVIELGRRQLDYVFHGQKGVAP